MPQLFPPSANTIARAMLLGGVILVSGAVACGYALYFSPVNTGVGTPVEQPVPFSHQHHVGGLGIDCRYCHTGVEKGRSAGIPPTETCMTCHSQVWRDAPVLQPVRDSWMKQEPLHWIRVNDLPDYVYFDHSIHIAKGIGCVSCHGRVDQMPLMAKGQSLFMRWCLDCHRRPQEQVRPLEAVYTMPPLKPAITLEEGKALVRDRHIDTERLQDCSNCHR
jgi:hypothetical protein